MTEIVFKPEKAPVVQGRGLYRAFMNRKPLDLLFRAKNAGEADAMLQYLFASQTRGKTLMVPPETMNAQEDEDDATEEKDEEKQPEERVDPAGEAGKAPGQA